MKIEIKKLHIENFKGTKQRTVEFGENTLICGANATGKTTIFDAFTWILFGKDSLGSAKFEIRPLDKNGKMIDNLEISVEAVISVDDEEYALKKVQKQKWVKKRGTNITEFQGNVNEFEINGYPKSEKEFKQFISCMIDEKVFNLVTNPVAFTSLPWKEQREILMQFVGTCTDVQIAEEYGEKFLILIPELKIASTDDILKKYTKAKNTLNKEMIEIPARIDEVSKQLATVDVGVLEVEKAAKEVALKKVEDELSCDHGNAIEINSKREQIMQLKMDRSDIQNKETELLMEKRRNIVAEHNKIESECIELRKKIGSLEFDIETEDRNKENLENQRNALLDELKRLKESSFPDMKPFPEYVPEPEMKESDLICPTCGQYLPEEVQKQLIKDYELRKKQSEEHYFEEISSYEKKYREDKEQFAINRENNIKIVTERGKKISEDIRLIQEKIDQYNTSLQNAESDLGLLEKQLSEKQKELSSIPTVADMSKNAEHQKISSQIISLENEIEEMSKETVGKTELEAKKAVLCDEISDIVAKIKSADNSKVKERIAELEKKKAEVGQKIAEQECMIDLTEEFIREKMNRISSVINEKFKVVSFRLFENQINGGLKECCECTINGIPYSSLNNGNRIIGGLDVIRSLSELKEVSCPIFIDNAESINEFNIPDMDSQMIFLGVTDDKELEVYHFDTKIRKEI